MDTFIKSNSRLIDIRSKQARDNLDLMVDYLCSSIVPDTVPPLNKLDGVTLQECHEYVSKFLYNSENAVLANNVLQNRSNISDSECIDGFSSIYDLERDNLIEVESKHFFESVAVLEHELIHILQALNNNNPEIQYNEFLSLFGELLSAEQLSEKHNNPDIYRDNLIRRCVKRMSYSVYGRDFEDETIENKSDYIKEMYVSSYDYMLGFVYAVRLVDLYHQDPNGVFQNFNLVLAGKKDVKMLLSEHHISLEDKGTVESFIKMVDSYRESVDMKYGPSIHRLK